MRHAVRPQVIIIGVGYVLGAVLFRRLPDLPPLTSLSTDPQLSLGRVMAAFLLPTAAATMYIVLRSLVLRHPLDRSNVAATLAVTDAILTRFVAFLTALHATILLALVGVLSGRTWAARIVPALLGLTLMSIGNLLPRTRPNRAMGIQTSQALADRVVWMRVHRAAGYLLVLLGGVILVGGMAVPAPLGPKMGRLIEPALLFGVPALVMYSKRLARVNRSER